MIANSSAEGLNTMIHAPAHRGGAFEGVMLALIIWTGAFIFTVSLDLALAFKLTILFAGMGVGVFCGYLLTRSINARRARRHAVFEAGYRAEQEKERQRKLTEAKVRGDI